MKKLEYTTSVSAPRCRGEGGGGGHSASARMCNLRCVRVWAWVHVLRRTPSLALKAFTLQKYTHRALSLQYRRVALRTTSGSAEARTEERSPSERRFEEVLRTGFAPPSLTQAAAAAMTTASNDAADQRSVILVAPHSEELTSASGVAATEAPEDPVCTGIAGGEALSVGAAASVSSCDPLPRANPSGGSSVSSLNLLPLGSETEAERRAHRTAELAFEQAMYGEAAAGGDGEGVAMGRDSKASLAPTSEAPTARLTNEAAGQSAEGRKRDTAVAADIAARVPPRPLPTSPLRISGGNLSIGAPPPPSVATRSQDRNPPTLATAATAPPVTFASAEAAFERALAGSAVIKQPSGNADASLSSETYAAAAEKDVSASLGAHPLSLALPASAPAYSDGDGSDAVLQGADETTAGEAIEGIAASDIREAVAEIPPQASHGDAQAGEQTAFTEAPQTIESGDADRVAVEKAVPPPTVSMRCAFNLHRWDASADHFGLVNALFRVTDHHTTAVTHIDPKDRVWRCMPLLDRLSKQELFFTSQWIQELERADGPSTAPLRPESAGDCVGVSASLPPTHREVIGRSKVLRTLVFRLLHMPHHWWDQVQEVVLLAAKEAEAHQRRRTTAVGVAATGKDTTGTPPVGGTGDVAEPALVSGSDAAAPDCVIRQLTAEDVQAAMTRIFGTDPLQVHFFSEALREALIALGGIRGSLSSGANVPSAAFEGPVAAWNAFLLTQRHCATGVCGPHVRPFSFCEGRPTITISDLTPLRYCEAAASWCDPPSADSLSRAASAVRCADVCTTDAGGGARGAWAGPPSPPCVPSAGTAAADTTATAWEGMSEEEQNAFLFGAESAQLSLRVRESGGFYAVFGQNSISFEMENTLREAESAAQQGKTQENGEAEAVATGMGEEHAAAKSTALELMRNEEAAQVRAYNVDRVVLQLTNGEVAGVTALPGGRSAVLSNLAADSAATSEGPPRQRRSSWRIGAITATSDMPFQWQLRNNEDVQLAALWQRFTRASTGDLIGNLLYVRRHADSLVHEALADVAVQTAFWLLFYARDEVRAVTHPKRTYETLWSLHHRLVLLFALRRSGASPPSSAPGWAARICADAGTAHPAFEALSPQSQVSYACFGLAHVPPRPFESAELPCPSSSLTQTTGRNDAPSVCFMKREPYASPADLYAALAGSYRARGVGDVGAASASALPVANSPVTVSESANFATLSALQRLAIAFCFPRNSTERGEVALLVPKDGGTGVSSTLTATALGTAGAAKDEPNRRAEPLMAAGSSTPTGEEALDEDRRMAPSASVKHQVGGLAKATTGDDSTVGDDARMRQVQSALEGRVYECVRSLRAAGVLAVPHHSLVRNRGGTGVLATFSHEQRRRVRRAVQDIAAAMIGGEAMERSAGDARSAQVLLGSSKAEGKPHPLPPAVPAMEAALASPRRRGRKPRVAATLLPRPTTAAPHDQGQLAGQGTMSTGGVSSRRKRGRRPRAASVHAMGGTSAAAAPTAAEQARDLSRSCRQLGEGHASPTREGERRESGVTDEEVSSAMALFHGGRTLL
ncbi:hypothetical protein LSCM1_03126 [Leishmania martiniquensis]|uniref:Uncharacterized protein n=1 Tax=Leishmania martiniquensis TaxID=1580590 RepID=A0A836GFZ5_9TRYP|nr:hypothetical protein LSCM1_03126 [Leishmania martiniquensis]